MTQPVRRVVYVTGSAFKRDENAIFRDEVLLDGDVPVNTLFEFDLRDVNIKETMEISISAMVMAEAKSAYGKLRVPCVVEHAGLIFEEYIDKPEEQQYPGGLTKPMWNALGDRFLEEITKDGRRVVAKAVVGYCDGETLRTFVGETSGTLANEFRGDRAFYWDTVFIPDDQEGSGELTYAELVASRGLAYKVRELSQSTKAMKTFLEWFREAPTADLWRD